MMLFRARQKAEDEFRAALETKGLDEDGLKAKVKAHPLWRSAFFRPPHKAVGVAANLALAV